jgi:hypothetical protein
MDVAIDKSNLKAIRDVNEFYSELPSRLSRSLLEILENKEKTVNWSSIDIISP